MNSTIVDNLLYKYDKNLTCNEMSKLIKDCDDLKKSDNTNMFKTTYNKFLNGQNIELSDQDTEKMLKLGLCKIASDNIDIIKQNEKINLTILEWWNKNIFGNYNDDNTNGFQKNIYYISFFIVLYLKLNILSKFRFSFIKFKYISIILPITCIILSIIYLHGFINKTGYLITISEFIFKLSILSILIGFSIYIKKNVSGILFSIMLFCSVFILGFQLIFMKENNNWFSSFIILLYIIVVSIYYILKNEKNTRAFQMLSILMIFSLVISYVFFNKNNIFSIIYYYLIIFVILIFIVMSNNNKTGMYEKIINIKLKPFSNKFDLIEAIVQICYIFFALLDSFMSVLSPQMSLVIMLIFRMILNRWFEPLNAIFASLSGYGMMTLSGSQLHGVTSNTNILDFDNLLNLFSNKKSNN